MSQVAQDPTAQARAKWIAANTSSRAFRDTFIGKVTGSPQDYSDAEKEQIQKGLRMESEVNQSTRLQPIKASTPLLNDAVAMTSAEGQHNFVQASAIVRAPLMAVVA